jgi:hypothetical protein
MSHSVATGLARSRKPSSRAVAKGQPSHNFGSQLWATPSRSSRFMVAKYGNHKMRIISCLPSHPQHWWRSQRSQNDSSSLFSITYKPTKGFWTGMGDFRGWETHLQIKWAWILQHGLLGEFGSVLFDFFYSLIYPIYAAISEIFSAFGSLVPEIWIMLVLWGGDILQHGFLSEFCSVLFDFPTV